MASDKKEYDVFKGLLSGNQVNTLESETILACVAEKSLSDLGNAEVVYVLHDPCDIRKPYASDMEDLGTVLSLQKTVVKGYSSFNSVAVTPDKQEVHLLASTLYSNAQADYVSQEHLHLIESDTSKTALLGDKKGNQIREEERALVLADTYRNGAKIAKQHLRESSVLLKTNQPNRLVCHVLDREFDDEAIFEQVETLQDEFVIRLKLNRLSTDSQTVYTPKGKISTKVKYSKLIDKKFTHQADFLIEKLDIKGKIYHQVNCRVEWESLIISAKRYTVLRISLNCGGKALFQHPMLLLTNRVIENADQARQGYKTYILRFKIEVVFRFLKQNMGWETFQVRDFNAIANLLALAFFLVGYFKELQEELAKHPFASFLCKLALSKGKITIFFLLQGLEKMIAYQEVTQWMKQENITHQQVDELIDELKLLKQ